jgi:hypothetical protein
MVWSWRRATAVAGAWLSGLVEVLALARSRWSDRLQRGS